MAAITFWCIVFFVLGGLLGLITVAIFTSGKADDEFNRGYHHGYIKGKKDALRERKTEMKNLRKFS